MNNSKKVSNKQKSPTLTTNANVGEQTIKLPATLNNQSGGLRFTIRTTDQERRLLPSILLKSCQCQHLAGFFAGFGVHEEVLDEDLWSGGVWCAVLAVVVLLEVVLFCYCFEDSTDLNGLAVGAGYTV